MGADLGDLRQALFTVALHSQPDTAVATHQLKARFPARVPQVVLDG